MPNRIIKESIRTSRNVNNLTDFQFRLWICLITYVDDFGRGSADPDLLKGFVFPRRKSVSESQIQKALLDLANIGMIVLYDVDGESYFYFPNWSSHQRTQTKKSKYPAPDENSEIHSTSQKSTVTHGESPLESNPSKNPNTNPNTNTNPGSTEPETISDSVTPVIELPLNDGSLFPVTQEQYQEWAGLYPAVDVIQQLRNMLGWLNSNPGRRKTKSGIKRFVTSWLSKEQDKYHPAAAGQGQQRGNGATFMDMWRDEYGGGQ